MKNSYNYSKFKAAVESTGAKYVSPDDICFANIKPIKLTLEQREIAEAEDRLYHAKLNKYYREHK